MKLKLNVSGGEENKIFFDIIMMTDIVIST